MDHYGSSSQCLTFFEPDESDLNINGAETQDSDFDFMLGASQTQTLPDGFSASQVCNI